MPSFNLVALLADAVRKVDGEEFVPKGALVEVAEGVARHALVGGHGSVEVGPGRSILVEQNFRVALNTHPVIPPSDQLLVILAVGVVTATAPPIL